MRENRGKRIDRKCKGILVSIKGYRMGRKVVKIQVKVRKVENNRKQRVRIMR